jgi:hypothetical protein
MGSHEKSRKLLKRASRKGQLFILRCDGTYRHADLFTTAMPCGGALAVLCWRHMPRALSVFAHLLVGAVLIFAINYPF